jgi:hypothetical protein
MKSRNYVILHLRALSAAWCASMLAATQAGTGSHYLAEKARELADRRRAEAEFFNALPFIP